MTHFRIFSRGLICTMALVFALGASQAQAQCSKVIDVRSGGLIYKNSAPLRKGGVGTPLIGYRKEPSLIMVSKNFGRPRFVIYSSNGKKLGSCPWASAHDSRGGRARCTMQTSSLRRAAVKASGSPKVLFKVNSSTCVSIPDAGRCYGSSKGLCGSLIK